MTTFPDLGSPEAQHIGQMSNSLHICSASYLRRVCCVLALALVLASLFDLVPFHALRREE